MTPEQEHLLTLLKEIDQICRRNNIPYYLAGGTLIGALRHKGFLPWDDDADLYMTREGFDRFVEVCKTELPANRAIQAAGLTPGYTNVFPRYVARDTTAIHTHQVLKAENDVNGDVIDILIIEPIADGDEAVQKYCHNIMLYSDVLNDAGVYGRRFGISAEDLREAFQRDDELGRIETFRHFERELASCFSEDGKRYVMRWGGNILLFDRAWFDRTVDLEFEGCSFMAPIGFSPYLRYHYGDEWYTLPNSVAHSSHDTAHSLQVPYTEALDFYKPKTDPEELHKLMRKRKLALLECAEEDYSLQTEGITLRSEVKRLELEKACQGKEAVIASALSSYNGEEIAPLFSGFLSWQLSREAIGRDDWPGAYRFHHPVLANLSDDLRHATLIVLFSTERIGMLRRMLDVILYSRESLDDFELELQKCLAQFAIAQDCWWEGDQQQATEILRQLTEEWPLNYSFKKFHALCAASLAESDTTTLRELVEQGLSSFPGDSLFQKLQADLLLAQGKKSEAMPLYAEAAEMTRDGLLLLDIKDKTGIVPRWEQEAFGLAPSSDADTRLKDYEPECSDDKANPSFGIIQTRLFNLLSELASICDSNNIDYVLSPRLVRSFLVHNKMPDKIGEYCLYMKPESILELLRILPERLPESRDYEYLANSPGYVGSGLRYYDTSTLYYHTDSTPRYRQHSLSVHIAIMTSEPFDKLGGEKLKFFKYSCGWGRSPKTLKRKIKWFSYSSNLEKTGREAFADSLLKEALGKSTSDSSEICIGSGKALRCYDASIFKGRTTIIFNEHSFRVPADVSLYVDSINPTNRATEEDVHIPPAIIASTTVSFDQLQSLRAFDPTLPQRKKAFAEKTTECRLIRRAFVREFKRIKVAVRLKELSLEMGAIKTQILEAKSNGNVELLWQLLEPYARFGRRFAEGISLDFDEEIYETLLWMLHKLDVELPEDADEDVLARRKIAQTTLFRIDSFNAQTQNQQ